MTERRAANASVAITSMMTVAVMETLWGGEKRGGRKETIFSSVRGSNKGLRPLNASQNL